jgi:hypothetical protein
VSLPPGQPARCGRRVAGGHPQIVAVTTDREVAVLVGAQDQGAHSGQQVQRRRCRVAVVVPFAGAEQGDPRGQQSVQRSVLGCGTVVGDLEDVDRGDRPRLPRRQLAPQRRLRGGLDVAGGQHPQPGRLDQQHHAGVVGCGGLAVHRSAGAEQPGRPQHPPRHVTGQPGKTGPPLPGGDAGGIQRLPGA